MYGTWKVTGRVASAGALLVAVAAGAGFAGAEWILARIFWIVAAIVIIAVVLTLIFRWLLAVQGRSGIVIHQAAPSELPAQDQPQLPAAERTAIYGGNHYHLHGADAVEAAARVLHPQLPPSN